MSAIEPLCFLIGINPKILSDEEYIILEAELFLRVFEELKNLYKQQYYDYFHLMRMTCDKENTMLEAKIITFCIDDILSTNEYSFEGIAYYTDTNEEVLHEAYAGLNIRPSVILLRRLIELHRTVRRDLYEKILKKIALEYLSVA